MKIKLIRLLISYLSKSTKASHAVSILLLWQPLDYFNLDEELIESYKNDPYLACNAKQEGWGNYIEMQK